MLGRLWGKVSAQRWWLALAAGAVLYLAFSVGFLFLGKLNADEGWYLYAGNLVFDGRLPYLDFAFTQTPLLPYVYGLPQFLFGPSLYLGRFTSLFFSLTTFACAVALAWRLQGAPAAALTALLLATFTTGIYHNTIVKTYALVALFFTLTLLTLTTRLGERVKYVLALGFAACAVLVRLSAAGFFVVIVVYILAVAQEKKVKIAVLGVLLFLGAVMVLLIMHPDRDVIVWNLVAYHLDQWGQLSLAERLGEIFRHRLWSLLRYLGLYILLAFLLFLSVLARRSGRVARQQQQFLLAGAAALLLFILSHFFGGGWYYEYVVPAIVAGFPLMAARSVQVYREGSARKIYRRLIPLLLLAIFLFYPVEGIVLYTDRAGDASPVAEVGEVASFVAAHSRPSEAIMVLEALWIPVVADRAVLPGMTMAQFSYQPFVTEKATRLHFVNGEIMRRYLVSGAPAVIIFTDYDLLTLLEAGAVDALRDPLNEHYQLRLEREGFGPRSERIFVYLRRDDALR